ncbi:MAG: hypothetical protein ACFFDT_18550, partial [Candidatus Hodarchaeota archaeon]
NLEFDFASIANMFFYATPLILTGLSVAVAFRAGMFNIGTEGQVIIGGFLAALVGSALAGARLNLHPIIMIPLLIVCGLAGGALWALLPALLKTRGVHEVITTIMMNYVAYTLMVFLIGDLKSPFSDKTLAGNVSPQTPPIASTGRIPTIFGREFSPLHWGFVINIFVCIIIYYILWRTQLGYETRAVGHNASAAKYGGISVNKNLVNVLLISGALGGLAGSLIVMGPLYGFFLYGSTAGLGFDGIAIAIIGENHPFGVLFGAILFGWLQASTTKLQQNQIPKDIANTMKGFMVLIVAVPLFSRMLIDMLRRYFGNIRSREWIKIQIKAISVRMMNFKSFVIRNRVSILSTFIFIGLMLIYTILSRQFMGGFVPYLDITVYTGYSYQIFRIILRQPLISIISCSMALVFIIGYVLAKRNGIRNSDQQLLLVYCITFLTISFFNLVNLLKQEIVLASVITAIILIILYQEYRSIERGQPSESKTTSNPNNNENDFNKNKLVLIYSFAIILSLVFAFLVVATENMSLPGPIWLFFVTLRYFGAVVGLIGLILVVICFFVLRRVPSPKRQSSIYYLPLIFISVTVLFGFISISTIFEMNSFLLFTQTITIAAPIGFAALGGMFSEKSGVVNIGLEGMMLAGAFVAVWVTEFTRNPWMGVTGAILAGSVMGLLHAVASIKFRADQVVVGVAINILASALSMLGLVFVWDVRGTSPLVGGLPNVKLLFLNDIPIVGELLFKLSGGNIGLSPLVYVFIFFIILSFWIIERTAFGLRVRAVGEHPRAADTLGINVFKMRYICVVLSGVLAALGGAQLTLGWAGIFGRDMTTGRGFVALAALIFGGWSPIGAGLASLLFGFSIAFRRQLESLGTKWAISLFGFIWRFEKLTPMLPYLITIVAVATVAKRMRPPAADGIPYVKEGG